jgi:small redox-active disulfide protein 2
LAKIQILGTGCPKCKKLTENAEKAARELDGDYKIIKVTDIKEIMQFGVMITPGLAVNNKVKSVGKVLSVGEIKEIIS